jgi:formate hydrogenlyase transcriptional activator
MLASAERHPARDFGSLKELKDAQEELSWTLDTLPVLSWRGLPDGARDRFSLPWHHFTGVSIERARGDGWMETIHPDDLGRARERWRDMVSSGQAGELKLRVRRFDGQYRWFLSRATPARDTTGKVMAWYGTDTDIEDLSQAEEGLRSSEEELRRLIDAIPQTIVVLANDGRAISANRSTLDYTGLSVDEVREPSFRERVFHPEDIERLRAERQEGFARGLPFSNEQRARGKDGHFRWFLIQYNPLRDLGGRLLRWYATGTDIDERKRSEQRVRNENQALREEINASSMFEEIVGSSVALQRVLANVARVASADSTVLISGETGTGKELIARAIHERSRRSGRAFIRVDCGAIPPPLLASELFGHEKGAFTGAVQRRIGRFESADGGTIFLDEVGELPLETQAALLRVLQEREFERVGSNRPIVVDVRVVAATNRDLKSEVHRGRFREDLYYRLNVFPIEVPALRDRAEDIPLLVEYFVERFAKKLGKDLRHIQRCTMDLVRNYDWPGNVRELQNVIERSVILSDGETLAIDGAWLRREAQPCSEFPATPTEAETTERARIEKALEASRGKVAGPLGAAVKLGVPRQTLDSRIRTLRINKHRFKAL